MRTRLVVAAIVIACIAPVAAFAGGEPRLAGDLEASGGVLAYHGVTGHARFYASAAGVSPSATIGPGTQGTAGMREADPESVAEGFLGTYGPLFGIGDATGELALVGSEDLGSRTSLRYRQVHEGIPVIAGEFVLTVGPSGVTAMNGEAAPLQGVPGEPAISAEAATAIARQAIAKAEDMAADDLLASTPELSVYYPPLLGLGPDVATLVWQTEVTSALAPEMRQYTLVDAVSGAVPLHFDRGTQARSRSIHDAAGGAALPGTLVRSEGQAASGDSEVDSAYQYAGDFYDFYFARFGRDSFDDAGGSLVTSVRYGSGCPNAFWNGTQTAFCAGMVTDDIVGHEFTHAVNQHTSSLYYYYQSGALDEGLADIFGELIDLTNGSTDDTGAVRWQVGEGSATGVLRDLGDPTLHSHPDRLTSPYWYCTYTGSDNGGVHVNSTVLGKAASLIADGGSFNGYTITGLGLDKMAAIFYEMQAHLLTSGSDYGDVYYLLPQACRNLVGSGGISEGDCDQVVAAVNATEMDEPPAVCGIAEAPYCPDGATCTDLHYDDMEDTGAGRWVIHLMTGSNIWYYVTGYATSGTVSLHGRDEASVRDVAAAMTTDVSLPAGTQAYLRFNHSYQFEFASTNYYDAGVVEYCLDGGSTWLDAAALFDANGYGGSIHSGRGNPLAGRPAFVANSLGYTSTRLDLSSLAGHSVRFRFRIGSDSSTAGFGWVIDDVRIYTAVGAPGGTPTATPTSTATTAPTATATATPSPTATTEPGSEGFSVSINGGALYTNSAAVILSLTAPADYGSMQISNDGGFGDATWEPFVATRPWRLTEYGSAAIPRTVYVRFRNPSLEEQTRSDDIILDTSAPTGAVQVTSTGGEAAGLAQVGLLLHATDDVSGVVAMALADDSLFTGAVWREYASTATWTGSSGTVYVRFRDGAGNVSTTYSAVYGTAPRLFVPLVQ